MADNTLNINLDQGSSRTHIFTITDSSNQPLDLSGYEARMQVRSSYGNTVALINCTLANGKLAITNAVLGIISLVLAPTDTSSIRFPNKEDDTFECVYDLEIVSPLGKVYKPAKGSFTINREVTR